MNALDQIVRTIYQQTVQYLSNHTVDPAGLVVRVRVNALTRTKVRCCAYNDLYPGNVREDQKETILGGPFEVEKDIPDNVYYLDLMVYNRVEKQLKFTLQEDSDVSS